MTSARTNIHVTKAADCRISGIWIGRHTADGHQFAAVHQTEKALRCVFRSGELDRERVDKPSHESTTFGIGELGKLADRGKIVQLVEKPRATIRRCIPSSRPPLACRERLR